MKAVLGHTPPEGRRDTCRVFPKVKDRTIYRLVANREIAGFKVGGSWRFRKSEIDQWTESNAIGPNNPGEQVEQKQ